MVVVVNVLIGAGFGAVDRREGSSGVVSLDVDKASCEAGVRVRPPDRSITVGDTWKLFGDFPLRSGFCYKKW